MWYPVAPVAPASEPITLAQARLQVRIIDPSDTDHDEALNLYIKAARAYVEAYCGQAFAARDMVANADGFIDMARLPFAPVNSITSIEYVDTAGAAQTLASSVYELRADADAVVLKYGQAWPPIQLGSRITLTASVGAVPPDDVAHAMLLFVADSFAGREPAKAGDWSTLDSLLCNHRRFA